MAGFERKAARYRQLQHEVDDVRISETSPNGAVTVTIDASGVLVNAQFTDRSAEDTDFPDYLRDWHG